LRKLPNYSVAGFWPGTPGWHAAGTAWIPQFVIDFLRNTVINKNVQQAPLQRPKNPKSGLKTIHTLLRLMQTPARGVPAL
jgi:hypothetical protein